MSKAAELAELHQHIGNLRRCVNSLHDRFGDAPEMRRVILDTERILVDLELLEMDAGELELAKHAGTFTGDEDSLAKQEHQRTWILVLSGVLCVTGITNTMLMSVTERSGEIGTLKCLGALDGFVVRLFLLESLLVGLVGSLVGVLAGYVLGILQVGVGLEFGLLSLRNGLAPIGQAAPIAVGLGTVLTVVSALYPTYIAARMDPVEAMRVEI